MTPPYPVMLLCQQLTQGGSERQLTEIALALDRTRFEPHVGVLRPEGIRVEELRRAGVPVTCFAVPSFRSPRALVRGIELRRYLKRHSIRLVHSFDTPMNLFGVPVGWSAGVHAVVSSQRAFRELSSPLARRLLRITDRLADAVVVNCHTLETHLGQDEKVPKDRIYVCYNGIDSEVFRPLATPSRPPALREATLVIGVVCALRPEKGLTTLLEAYASVRHLRPGMRLLFVGSGPMLDELRQLAEIRGILAECIFQPMTSDVPDWLRAIDIFVLPSLSEALSNSLMEAMATGCAVIASRVGGNPELVTEGKTGLLFRASDSADLAVKLFSLIEDEPLRKTLAQAGSAWLHSNFSRQVSVRRMEEIYTRLLSDAQPSLDTSPPRG